MAAIKHRVERLERHRRLANSNKVGVEHIRPDGTLIGPPADEDECALIVRIVRFSEGDYEHQEQT